MPATVPVNVGESIGAYVDAAVEEDSLVPTSVVNEDAAVWSVAI